MKVVLLRLVTPDLGRTFEQFLKAPHYYNKISIGLNMNVGLVKQIVGNEIEYEHEIPTSNELPF